eukprot:3009876-Prymnesium_polylepis.2
MNGDAEVTWFDLLLAGWELVETSRKLAVLLINAFVDSPFLASSLLVTTARFAPEPCPAEFGLFDWSSNRAYACRCLTCVPQHAAEVLACACSPACPDRRCNVCGLAS